MMGLGRSSEATSTSSAMWSFILYVLAVVVGLLLFMFYEPKEEKEVDLTDATLNKARSQKRCTRFSSLCDVLGISIDGSETDEDTFQAFQEHFQNVSEISEACSKAGLGKCSLIIGIDFTASNEWQGRKSFGGNCLHKLSGSKVFNPYQKVIWILGQVLAPFAEENLIPAYGFGDSVTCDEDVFPFNEDESPCQGFQEVLDSYNFIVKGIILGGPTSFAPIIAKAIEIVKETQKYHILVIIADGQVTEEGPTIEAIVEASKHPISIIVVGVGDGPWNVMEEFDHRLPKRKFDNFHFVDYCRATMKARNPDAAFAVKALMEIPDQYKYIKSLGYLKKEDPEQSDITAGVKSSVLPSCSYCTSQGGSTHSSPSGSPRNLHSGQSGCSPRLRHPTVSTAI